MRSSPLGISCLDFRAPKRGRVKDATTPCWRRILRKKWSTCGVHTDFPPNFPTQKTKMSTEYLISELIRPDYPKIPCYKFNLRGWLGTPQISHPISDALDKKPDSSHCPISDLEKTHTHTHTHIWGEKKTRCSASLTNPRSTRTMTIFSHLPAKKPAFFWLAFHEKNRSSDFGRIWFQASRRHSPSYQLARIAREARASHKSLPIRPRNRHILGSILWAFGLQKKVFSSAHFLIALAFLNVAWVIPSLPRTYGSVQQKTALQLEGKSRLGAPGAGNTQMRVCCNIKR